MNIKKEFKVLSIDAWGNLDDGYVWNMWHKVDTYLESENGLLTEESALKFFFYSLGYKGDFLKFKSLYSIEDDQYNLTLINDHDSHKEINLKPLYAIEYGSQI